MTDLGPDEAFAEYFGGRATRVQVCNIGDDLGWTAGANRLLREDPAVLSLCGRSRIAGYVTDESMTERERLYAGAVANAVNGELIDAKRIYRGFRPGRHAGAD